MMGLWRTAGAKGGEVGSKRGRVYNALHQTSVRDTHSSHETQEVARKGVECERSTASHAETYWGWRWRSVASRCRVVSGASGPKRPSGSSNLRQSWTRSSPPPSPSRHSWARAV